MGTRIARRGLRGRVHRLRRDPILQGPHSWSVDPGCWRSRHFSWGIHADQPAGPFAISSQMVRRPGFDVRDSLHHRANPWWIFHPNHMALVLLDQRPCWRAVVGIYPIPYPEAAPSREAGRHLERED